MSELRIFQNAQFGNVRVAMNESNEPLFCLLDLCNSLGLSNNRKVKSQLDDDVTLSYPIFDSLGREQEATFVTEAGMYTVILRSDSPNAKQMQRWVTSEVLPSIRKHGAYMTGETLAQMLQNPDSMITLLTALKTEKDKNAALSIQNAMNVQSIEAMKPKAAYYDTVLQSNTLIQTDLIAARLGISAIKLNRFLCDIGIQRKLGDAYVLGSDLRGKGLEGYKTYAYTDPATGKKKSKPHMYWTEKGVKMIIDLYTSEISKTLN